MNESSSSSLSSSSSSSSPPLSSSSSSSSPSSSLSSSSSSSSSSAAAAAELERIYSVIWMGKERGRGRGQGIHASLSESFDTLVGGMERRGAGGNGDDLDVQQYLSRLPLLICLQYYVGGWEGASWRVRGRGHFFSRFYTALRRERQSVLCPSIYPSSSHPAMMMMMMMTMTMMMIMMMMMVVVVLMTMTMMEAGG